MKNDIHHPVVEKSDFGKFTDFFLKYLHGSSSFDEAFIRASNTYRKLFKTIPYQNCQSFLSDFYKSQYEH